MWGISVAAWEAIGTWIASIGTVGAVGAAIWIARRDNSVRLRIFATVGQVPADPAVPIERKHLWITATNIGRRTVTLNLVGWRTGLIHHRIPWVGIKHGVMNVGPPVGPKLPLKLADGDNASWVIPLDDWLDGSAAKLVPEPRWLRLRTIRVQA